MYTALALLNRLLPSVRRATPAWGVPRHLLESAGARAGQNPQQARELRRAAFAYLRVVR